MSKRRSSTDLLQQVGNIEEDNMITVNSFKDFLNQNIEKYKSNIEWKEINSHPFGLRSMYKHERGLTVNFLEQSRVEDGIHALCSMISNNIGLWQRNNKHIENKVGGPYDIIGQASQLALRIIHLESSEIPEIHHLYYEIEIADRFPQTYIGGHSTNFSDNGQIGAKTLDFVFHSLAYLLGITVHHVVIEKETVEGFKNRDPKYI